MISDTTGTFKTQELPELEIGQARYIMAMNGVFYEQNDQLFHASTLIKEFYNPLNFGTMHILDHQEFFVPRFPKIPADLMAKCLGFFSYVEKKDDVECGLVLLYDPDTYRYSWCCPEQECSSADLKFITPVPGKDYDERLIHFGDIHLHPGMHAYHSSTDVGDEMTASDGLHLVYGTHKKWGLWNSETKKNEPDTIEPEFCAVFVTDGNRFKIEPSAVLESLDVQPVPFPKVWYDQCDVKKWAKGGWWSSKRGKLESKFADKEYAPHHGY